MVKHKEADTNHCHGEDKDSAIAGLGNASVKENVPVGNIILDAKHCEGGLGPLANLSFLDSIAHCLFVKHITPVDYLSRSLCFSDPLPRAWGAVIL